MRRRTFLAGGLAAAGGLSVSGVAYSSRKVREDWPPLGQTIDVDGVATHYWEEGSGTPVILVHGASSNLRDWTFRFAPRLARRFRVIAFDRPGHGYSGRLPRRSWSPAAQATHLRAAAVLLGAERPVVVGHSWGGALAMAWGLHYPDEVRGIVTIAGATMPWGGDLPFLFRLGASPLGPLVGAAASVLASESRVVPMIRNVFAPQAIPDGYLEHFGWPLSTRWRSFYWNARDLARLDGELVEQSRGYPSMRAPVEILHGDADRSVPAERHSVGMHELVPTSRLTLLPGLGHMPHHFAGDAIESAISRLAA